MTIPDFKENGWLPKGIHDTTVDEMMERFGHSSGSDWRHNFMIKLLEYINEAKQCEFIKFLIINGSFISNKLKPNDIDIVVVLTEDFDLTSAEVKPFEYNLTSANRVKRIYHYIQVVQVVKENSEFYEEWVGFLCKNKNKELKGILRIKL